MRVRWSTGLAPVSTPLDRKRYLHSMFRVRLKDIVVWSPFLLPRGIKVEPYLPMGEGANKPAKAPTAAEPNAIKPSGIVAAVLMLK